MPQVDHPAPNILEEESKRDLSPKTVTLDTLKTFKRRHMLRIGALDILGRLALDAATAQLSALADVVVGRALGIVARERLAAAGLEGLPGRFAVIGMGKLGGEELNYSSDIESDLPVPARR